MSEWKPIEEAPTGTYKTVKMAKGEKRVFVPQKVIVLYSNNVVDVSWCLENGRWNGFTEEKPPRLFQHLPQPPKE